MHGQTEDNYADHDRHQLKSCNYAQRAFHSRLDKAGETIGILADQRMGRQRTTTQTKPDISEGPVIMPSKLFPAAWTRWELQQEFWLTNAWAD